MLRSILVLFTFLLTNGDGAIKKWLISTNYNNSNNWDKGRVPCLTDTVVFPKDLQMPIELPGNDLSMYKMILPAEGGLIFPYQGEIVLSNTKVHGKCDGGEITFKRKGIAKWLDYENWASNSNEATPHTERIPCRHDHVEFPSNSTFYIELPPYTTTVSTVTIQGRNLSGKAWDELLLSEVGFKEFPIGEFVVASGEKCERQDRCDECADFPTYCRPCSEEICENPVKPLGFCCPICGGYLLFTEKHSTVKDVKKAVATYQMENIVWHVSYISGYVQIVLVQKSEHFSIDETVKGLRDYLLKKNLGLQSTHYRVSGSMIKRRSPGATVGIFFGCMLAVILLTFGIVSYYHNDVNVNWNNIILNRSGFSGRFMFARFENVTGVVEISEEQLVEAEDSERNDDVAREFDNPMYTGISDQPLIESVEFSEVPLEENGEKMCLETINEKSEKVEFSD